MVINDLKNGTENGTEYAVCKKWEEWLKHQELEGVADTAENEED